MGRGKAGAAEEPANSAIAFFDVDETIIGPKSMFSFLEFYFDNGFRSPGAYGKVVDRLRAMAAAGAPREDVNRTYYRLFQGASVDYLRGVGREWFAHVARDPDFWRSPTVERLHRHRADGDLVVLLSGSFFACLEPISEAVGAHWALGTRPVVRDGRFTGEVVVPMIGRTKAVAAAAAAAVRGVDPGDCFAYGDHVSDLWLLSAVGTPVVVGEDTRLAEHAEQRGWERIRFPFVPRPVESARVGGAPLTPRDRSRSTSEVPRKDTP